MREGPYSRDYGTLFSLFQHVPIPVERRDQDLSNWYASDVIDVNMAETVGSVATTVTSEYGVSQESSKRSRSTEQNVGTIFQSKFLCLFVCKL